MKYVCGKNLAHKEILVWEEIADYLYGPQLVAQTCQNCLDKVSDYAKKQKRSYTYRKRN